MANWKMRVTKFDNVYVKIYLNNIYELCPTKQNVKIKPKVKRHLCTTLSYSVSVSYVLIPVSRNIRQTTSKIALIDKLKNYTLRLFRYIKSLGNPR